eukprot:1882793-Alexandrium_andersonii.AAC.1
MPGRSPGALDEDADVGILEVVLEGSRLVLPTKPGLVAGALRSGLGARGPRTARRHRSSAEAVEGAEGGVGVHTAKYWYPSTWR